MEGRQGRLWRAARTACFGVLAFVGCGDDEAGRDARVDALLDSWQPQTTTSALRRLQRTARHTARLSALIERQQAALTAQLDTMEQ